MKYNKLFKNDDSRVQPKNVTDTFENSNHGKRYTQEEFIERSKVIHGDKYDYSYVNFVNTTTPVLLYCKECEEFFEALPSSLLRGIGHSGCNKWNTKKFRKYLIDRYGDQADFSKTEYVGRKGTTIIICPEHGEQEAKISQLLDPRNKSVCPKCARNHKTSKEEFIAEAIKVYGDVFDFSESNYVNLATKIDIKCKLCGEVFSTIPKYFLKHQVHICGEYKVKDQESFIRRAKEVHGDRYDLSEAVYRNYSTPVKIICPKHGPWYPTPINFLNGCICRECYKEEQSANQTLSQEKVLERFHKVHGDKYDYSKVVYKKANEKVTIICKKHNHEFEQTPADHWSGQGCPICGKERTAEALKGSYEDFIRKSVEIFGDSYDYSLSKDYFIDWNTPVPILCRECGDIFYRSPAQHISSRNGCPHCNASLKEKYIKSTLEKLGLKEYEDFIFQKTFDNLRSKRPLKFDFYLMKYNTCIEYQGEYHYKPFNDSEEALIAFKESLERDQMKRDFCKKENIHLIEIKYTVSSKQIEEFLISYLKDENLQNQPYIFIEKADYRERRSNQFIEKVESLFGKDKYDFSKMNYINFKTPVEIIEKETNKVFTVTPKYLIERGKNLKEKSN